MLYSYDKWWCLFKHLLLSIIFYAAIIMIDIYKLLILYNNTLLNI